MSVLPYYLAIGMPYELFWLGEPVLAKVYREAHEMRSAQTNQELWVQGQYNLCAFRSVVEALAMAFGGKGGKPSEYPREPFPITEYEQKLQTERNKQRTLQWVADNQH